MAIKGFRHKGLERFFSTGTKAGIQAKHADRLRLILGRLNVATGPGDMNLPGLGCTSSRARELEPGPSRSAATGASRLWWLAKTSIASTTRTTTEGHP